jgi:hypothetical protein
MTHTRLLETPKQLSERSGLSVGQIRTLMRTGRLECVRVGCRDFIPAGAFEKFIEEGRKKPWEGATKDAASGISKSAGFTTSPGPSTVAAVSAARLRQTATKLKSSSQNGFNAG